MKDTVKPEDDHIKCPPYYSRYTIEPITFIMQNDLPFHVGNIIKYSCRAGYKDQQGLSDIESEILDLQKVMRYAQMRINQLQKKDIL